MKHKIFIFSIFIFLQTQLWAQVPGFVGRKNVLEININPLHTGVELSPSIFDTNKEFKSVNKYITPSITYERVIGRRSSLSLSLTSNKANYEPFSLYNSNFTVASTFSATQVTMKRVALQYHYNLKQWGLSPLGFYMGLGVSRNFLNATTTYKIKTQTTPVNENYKIWGLEGSVGNRFITKNNISINWGLRSLFIPIKYVEAPITYSEYTTKPLVVTLARNYVLTFYIGAGYVF